MLATKSNSYIFQKGGVWYLSRRVPADLRRHYRTGRTTYSLRTKSIRDAGVRAMSDAAKLDRHWHIIRMSSDDIPGKHSLEEPEEKNIGQGPSLSDAVALYLRLKGQNKPHAFEATLKRGCGHLIDSCGIKVLEA